MIQRLRISSRFAPLQRRLSGAGDAVIPGAAPLVPLLLFFQVEFLAQQSSAAEKANHDDCDRKVNELHRSSSPTKGEIKLEMAANGGHFDPRGTRIGNDWEIDQLLAAGRCISTTVEAHGSTRVSPTCMAFGQAAGTAAALAVRHGVTPRDLDTEELRRVLISQGANLGQDAG